MDTGQCGVHLDGSNSGWTVWRPPRCWVDTGQCGCVHLDGSNLMTDSKKGHSLQSLHPPKKVTLDREQDRQWELIKCNPSTRLRCHSYCILIGLIPERFLAPMVLNQKCLQNDLLCHIRSQHLKTAASLGRHHHCLKTFSKYISTRKALQAVCASMITKNDKYISAGLAEYPQSDK